MSDDLRDFHLRLEYDKLGEFLSAAFLTAFTTVNNVTYFKKIESDI